MSKHRKPGPAATAASILRGILNPPAPPTTHLEPLKAVRAHPPLSPEGEAALRALARHWRETGGPPSLRWIAGELGSPNPKKAQRLLESLERRGLALPLLRGTARKHVPSAEGWRQSGMDPPDLDACPYCGHCAARAGGRG